MLKDISKKINFDLQVLMIFGILRLGIFYQTSNPGWLVLYLFVDKNFKSSDDAIAIGWLNLVSFKYFNWGSSHSLKHLKQSLVRWKKFNRHFIRICSQTLETFRLWLKVKIILLYFTLTWWTRYTIIITKLLLPLIMFLYLINNLTFPKRLSDQVLITFNFGNIFKFQRFFQEFHYIQNFHHA